jgi:uncharacterized protein YabN with tetrapyrrole methylase and pyrophosphatase domain
MSSDAGAAFQVLVDIMARLRGPQGCPWDREQTLASLRSFVLEETHEVLDAIDRGDTDALRGEIGDLIFEGVFLAQICADAGERRSVLAGVPRALPALLRAHEIGTRVGAVGFEWARAADVVDKIEEEVAELRQAVASEGPIRTEEEMGDLLFSISNLARRLGIDSESALRKANEKFTKRFTAMEERLHSKGSSVHEATLEEMEAEWQVVKATQLD